ncbi:sulfite exporter TauE/SafE family protein [Oceanicoccus sp. KOV_DT_Chl]|uniref:sulfite exporter TauE/SafE family protein n=1 Tax=Oceanicoccus sp. KOV_DT_Chl TaxID=1904639 RepID=UPI000C7AAD11|nr:sulfite exporter TauE/SafE family protein [Oceanicoccus sp. KOV_DT_Chl]
MTELSLVSALLIGFLGSTHCLGMCGGIAAVLGVQSDNRFSRLLSYNCGRLVTYTLIGAVTGLLGEQLLVAQPQFTVLLRVLAGVLMVAMGLYVSQWWMGLTQLERAGAKLWRMIQPLAAKVLPISNHRQALQLGILWGLLPCGLVYSTLSWALATADWRQSALIMLAFGVGTLPAMLSVGFISEKVLQQFRQQKIRWAAGVLIMIFGVLTLVAPLQHSGHRTIKAGADIAPHQHH